MKQYATVGAKLQGNIVMQLNLMILTPTVTAGSSSSSFYCHHLSFQSQYQGAAQPVQVTQSRRLDIALQHIHEGYVTFQVYGIQAILILKSFIHSVSQSAKGRSTREGASHLIKAWSDGDNDDDDDLVVMVQVLRASHAPSSSQETSLLVVDYEGIKVSAVSYMMHLLYVMSLYPPPPSIIHHQSITIMMMMMMIMMISMMMMFVGGSTQFCESVSLVGSPTLSLPYHEIDHWEVVDQFAPGSPDNGLRVYSRQGTTFFFEVRRYRHTYH